MYDEKKLLEKVKKGDIDSFNYVVEKYQKQIFNVVYRFMGNFEDANDMTQETFLRAFKSINSFRNDASLKTWLYRIATNVCKDELRKRKKAVVVSLDSPIISEYGNEIERQFESCELTPEEQFEVKEDQSFVQNIINSLPEDYRIILILREIHDLTYEEIANVLDCSLGTVKSRLSRARKHFKDKLLAYKEQNLSFKRQAR